MIGESTKTAGDLSGYVQFEAYTGGYNCPHCGAFVNWNQFHSCYSASPPYSYGYVPTWQPTFNPILGEIKELLEKILEKLT